MVFLSCFVFLYYTFFLSFFSALFWTLCWTCACTVNAECADSSKYIFKSVIFVMIFCCRLEKIPLISSNMPRQIMEIKDFLLTARRKDAKCKLVCFWNDCWNNLSQHNYIYWHLYTLYNGSCIKWAFTQPPLIRIYAIYIYYHISCVVFLEQNCLDC